PVHAVGARPHGPSFRTFTPRVPESTGRARRAPPEDARQGMLGKPTDDAAITFADAGKQFDGSWVVEHLDLDVPRGTISGLIGPSGCGRTTTVRLATGVYRPDHGEVCMLGHPSSEMRARDRAAIGYLPQQPALFDQLSLRENLNFHASLNGVRFRRK